MAFADTLIALRKARGITQEELANELQLSRQAVGKWESGQSLPETDKLLAVSRYFGVTADYLLEGKGQPQNANQNDIHIQVESKSKSKFFQAGLVGLVLGVLTGLTVIIVAAMNLPSTNTWSTAYPSKLWFLIFAGTSPFRDGADGLGLGWVFVFGVIMAAAGIVLLIMDTVKRKR